MAESFVGEVRLFAFNRIPSGWLNCDGRLLQIREYQALFSLMGVTYGGDGRATFGIPDLRGRVAVAATTTSTTAPYHLGGYGGAEAVTVPVNAMPSHNHSFNVDSDEGTLSSVRDAVYAAVPATANTNLYAPFAASPFPIDSSMLAVVGNGVGHNNMQPYLALTYAICFSGIYPPRP